MSWVSSGRCRRPGRGRSACGPVPRQTPADASWRHHRAVHGRISRSAGNQQPAKHSVKLRRSSSILSTVEESSAATGLASPCTAAALAAAAAAACRSCAVRPGTALARGRPRWPERRPHSRLGRPATEREVGRGLRRSRLPTSRSSNLRPAQRTPIPDRARLAPQLARELVRGRIQRRRGVAGLVRIDADHKWKLSGPRTAAGTKDPLHTALTD
jgi:hypothetical protein